MADSIVGHAKSSAKALVPTLSFEPTSSVLRVFSRNATNDRCHEGFTWGDILGR